MHIIGYQGDVDKIFHDVVNRIHVDYAALLWWDFLHYVQQKNDVIQYPRFTKLIIAGLMKKFPSIPQRLEDDCHSINDDILLVSVYTTGNVTVQGMLIEDKFLTDDICAIKEYKETPSAHKTPTLTAIVGDVVQKKKRKQVAGETILQRKSLKVIITQKKPSTTPIPPPSDDIERDEIAEATQLSLALHKIAKIAEDQENVEIDQKKLMKEDIEKIVDGDDEESYASEFADSVFQDNDDDSNNIIESGSHKEHLESVYDVDENKKEKKHDKKDDDNDDDDNDDHTDHTLDKTQETGSL
ncbi:hypothetical protein Tco_0917212 [Tanacetum coccineum]